MSNSKRSKKSNPKQSSSYPSNKSENARSRKRKNAQIRCGAAVLSSSKLSKEVRDLIDTVFNDDNDLNKELIEEPAVRLLEEVTEEEALHAVQEFAERYKVAKHKILRSKAGYFRGVCQKYWKQNRETKKLELLRKAAINPSPNGKYTRELSALVSETIESLFTPASGLAVSIIDDSVQRRLTSLTDEQAIEALHEFCSAVMYRQDRIRNMNAYLMNIIKRRTTRSHSSSTKGSSSGQDRTKSQTPSSNSGTRDIVGERPEKPSPSSAPNKPTRRPVLSSPSPSSSPRSDEELAMKRIRSAGAVSLMRHKPVVNSSNDPRLSLQLKSNPLMGSFQPAPREPSPESPPPQWNLTRSAPSAPFHPPPRRSRNERPRAASPPIHHRNHGAVDRFRYRKSPMQRRSPSSSSRASAPKAEFFGYPSDDDEDDDDNCVYVGDYGEEHDDEEDDVPSIGDDDVYDDLPPPSPPLHVLPSLNKQRPSNGPPHHMSLMARNSKPLPAVVHKEEYTREIQQLQDQNKQLQDENKQLRFQMERMQEQLDRLTNHMQGFESPQIHPAPYYPPTHNGWTPPTSGSNASMGRPFYGEGGPYPPPSYIPPFHGGIQPPFLNGPYMPPSNPNAPMFSNLSAPNSIGPGLPAVPFAPPGYPPHPHAFAMGPM